MSISMTIKLHDNAKLIAFAKDIKVADKINPAFSDTYTDVKIFAKGEDDINIKWPIIVLYTDKRGKQVMGERYVMSARKRGAINSAILAEYLLAEDIAEDVEWDRASDMTDHVKEEERIQKEDAQYEKDKLELEAKWRKQLKMPLSTEFDRKQAIVVEEGLTFQGMFASEDSSQGTEAVYTDKNGCFVTIK